MITLILIYLLVGLITAAIATRRAMANGASPASTGRGIAALIAMVALWPLAWAVGGVLQ
jgi:hypothetical protein